jgi:tubulin polyglutamylase TTLL4
MPITFILPNDSENFENEFKKSKKNIWIAKPVNMSRGRFIKLIYNNATYKKLCNNENNNIQYLISKYLDKPHLLNNKKYDLRIYVIVLSFTPLKIYLYYNGLVRFATEDYAKNNFDNIFIHLTNYSINKQNPNYKNNLKDNKEISEMEEIEEENEQCDDSSKWSLVEYRNYFKKEGKEKILDKIWKQIEDVVIKTMINVSEINSRDLPINKNNNVFELYGLDIFVDEKFKVWLLEVNVNPSLHCNSPLDLSIKTDLIADLFNLIGIVPFNHNNNEEVYNLSRKKNSKFNYEIKLPKINKNNNYEIKSKGNEVIDEYYRKIIENFREEKMRAELTGFELIFPKKNNVQFYSKILKDSKFNNEANNVLWDFVLKTD